MRFRACLLELRARRILIAMLPGSFFFLDYALESVSGFMVLGLNSTLLGFAVFSSFGLWGGDLRFLSQVWGTCWRFRR